MSLLSKFSGANEGIQTIRTSKYNAELMVHPNREKYNADSGSEKDSKYTVGQLQWGTNK